MSEDVPSSVNVIVVAFVQDANAYEALTTLKELDSQHQIELRGAAVVERAKNGEIVNKDQVTDNLAGSAAGGIVEQIRAKLAELRAKLDRHKQGAAMGS